ncbi:MAG: response regulator, partial [Deltaproteobacteria bacterium]|nr:response regulator [Deltaproteobacteria bacterium]
MSDFRAMNKPSENPNPESEIIRVLLIEDNPGDARLVREMLAESGTNRFNLEHVERISQGLTRLSQENFQVILLDLTLPDGHGLETVRRVCNVAPHIPVLVLTGLNDETIGIRAVQQGAQDYLVKGQMDGNLLMRAIRYATERKRAEETLRRSEEKAKRLAQENEIVAEIGRI